MDNYQVESAYFLSIKDFLQYDYVSLYLVSRITSMICNLYTVYFDINKTPKLVNIKTIIYIIRNMKLLLIT